MTATTTIERPAANRQAAPREPLFEFELSSAIGPWTLTPASSNMAAYAYNPLVGVLTVLFNSHGCYRIAVTPDIADGLAEAPSKGQYYNRVIKGNFRTSRIEDVDPASLSFPAPPALPAPEPSPATSENQAAMTAPAPETKKPTPVIRKMTVGYDVRRSRDYQSAGVSIALEIELPDGASAGAAFAQAKAWITEKALAESQHAIALLAGA